MSVVLEAREPNAKYLIASRPSLIREFELFATAPSAVTKLRELILVLAVRGKIVAQHREDEPASALVAQIEKEKIRLISEKRLRNRSELPSILDAEQSFSLPVGWVWSRLGNLGDWGAGATPSRSRGDYYGGDIPWFKSGELTGDSIGQSEETVTPLALKECSLRLNQVGDVLVAMYGATIGKTAILAKVGTTNQAVCACTPFSGFDKRYLLLLLKALRPYFVSIGAGGAQPNISREKLIATVVGLPPLAEQLRIVARVEELMKLCDALEARGRLADEQHARLTSTLFDALAASESAHALTSNWQRIDEHFDLLLDRPEAIDALEETILALAMQGKLVQQDPQDTPVSSADAKRMVGRLSSISEKEIPYKVPTHWRWCRLGWCAELINGDRGKNYPNRLEYVPAGVPFINTGHIQVDGTLSRTSMHHLTKKKFDSLRGGKIRAGDLVYCLRGATLGKTAIVEYTEGAIASSLVIIRLNEKLAARYTYYFLRSPLGRALIKRFDNGSAQPNLSAESVKRYVIPVPPLAEQYRIVACVEELRQLCAQLRERFTSARRTQSQLAEALVAEVA